MAPRQRIDPDVQEEIERLALRAWGAAQIERELSKNQSLAGRLPTLRTIQRIVRTRTPPDASEIWTLVDSEPEHVAGVLEVLAAASLWSEGQKKRFTRAEVRWVTAVKAAAPDLPAREVYPLARLYLLRAGDEEDRVGSPDLDALLAFAPWRGAGALATYQEAIQTRQVPWPPVWWANASDYRQLLHDMGFLYSLIDDAKGDYQRLLDLTHELETFGIGELHHEGS